MSNKAKQKTVTVLINPNVYKELSTISKTVGFDSVEMLVSNYLREVALAARTEIATQETRQKIAKASVDLDHLLPKTKPSK
ncbi:MAG TPA: hypothetical protein VLF90_00380 [Patescibacteria group bacterium]|nr:hypothetical protein [Patescibacteria group bacterium]